MTDLHSNTVEPHFCQGTIPATTWLDDKPTEWLACSVCGRLYTPAVPTEENHFSDVEKKIVGYMEVEGDGKFGDAATFNRPPQSEGWEDKLRSLFMHTVDRDNGIPEATAYDEDEVIEFVSNLLSSQRSSLIEEAEKHIDERIAYEQRRAKDYSNGFSGNESGPCCEKCKMSNPRNPLQALCGCKNPFQVATTCQCHIPFRKVAVSSRIEILSDLKVYLRILKNGNK